MNTRFERSLFIFRRDLRLEDNTGLLFALHTSKEVIPCFIFTPEQLERNPYKGSRCLQFMIESLEDLQEQLAHRKGHLHLFYGKPEEIVSECIQKLSIDAVIVNKDCTPYSFARDRKIEKLCANKGIAFHSFNDLTLHPPEDTLKADGKPYSVFTPFYKNASKLPVAPPHKNHKTNYSRHSIPFAEGNAIYQKILPERMAQAPGGRAAALQVIKQLKQHTDYSSLRDFPEKEATTHLSAHLKFTTISPRELYQAIVEQLGPDSELVRSLYWRDFFTSIAQFFPHVFSGAFHQKFDALSWSEDKQSFHRWCTGQTGFPLVDAGMRELLATGFMQGRVRMVVGSFLVKDLHIDWRWGEKYFANTLIDYDPALNNGNWQWVASTGCDAQPYFRIFNPWAQTLKFDPDCKYIKRWVPELVKVPCQAILKWHEKKHHEAYPSYSAPMLDHSVESKKTLASYQSI